MWHEENEELFDKKTNPSMTKILIDSYKLKLPFERKTIFPI